MWFDWQFFKVVTHKRHSNWNFSSIEQTSSEQKEKKNKQNSWLHWETKNGWNQEKTFFYFLCIVKFTSNQFSLGNNIDWRKMHSFRWESANNSLILKAQIRWFQRLESKVSPRVLNYDTVGSKCVVNHNASCKNCMWEKLCSAYPARMHSSNDGRAKGFKKVIANENKNVIAIIDPSDGERTTKEVHKCT